MIRPSDTVLGYAAAAMLLAILSLSGALWLEHTLHEATRTTLKAAERERDAALSNEAATATTWQLSHLELQAQLQACQRQWIDVQSGSDAALQQRARERRLSAAELHHPRASRRDYVLEEIDLVGHQADCGTLIHGQPQNNRFGSARVIDGT